MHREEREAEKDQRSKCREKRTGRRGSHARDADQNKKREVKRDKVHAKRKEDIGKREGRERWKPHRDEPSRLPRVLSSTHFV